MHDQVHSAPVCVARKKHSRIIHAKCVREVFDHEALPGSADLGVALKCLEGGDVQQTVEQARVANVYLRTLDLPLFHVRAPRLQASDHESRFEGVQITAHGMVRNAERATKFGAVPDLGMIVGQHRPETIQRRARHTDSQLRHVALQEGAHEVDSPPVAVRVAAHREGTGEAAPQPKPPHLPGGDFTNGEARQFVVGDAPGQRLRTLPQQSGPALPRTRKRAGRGTRSANTRRVVKMSGNRWISSSTTSPRSGDRASNGSASRARSALDSRSKKCVGPARRPATSLARVVLPTCRAPTRPTTGVGVLDSPSCLAVFLPLRFLRILPTPALL